jgi:hypothetical protein
MRSKTNTKVEHSLLHAAFMALLLSHVPWPGISFAEDILFIPRASLSISQYNFTQSKRPGALAPTGINNNDFPEVNFDVTFKMLGVGGSFLKKGYYFDAFYQKSLKEEDSFILKDPALPDGRFSENFKGDREDYTLTFGKKILDKRAGIYIGYKDGKSQAPGDQGQNLKFQENGFFIGGNYVWPLTKRGSISINLAYARLDGNLSEKINNPAFASPAVLAAPLDTNASSDARGLSYGISWSSRITDHVSYTIGLDTKKYIFKNVKDSNPNAIPSEEFEEKFRSLNFSGYYLF